MARKPDEPSFHTVYKASFCVTCYIEELKKSPEFILLVGLNAVIIKRGDLFILKANTGL